MQLAYIAGEFYAYAKSPPLRSLVMHLGNGALTPECAALAFGAAGAGLATAAVDMAKGWHWLGQPPKNHLSVNSSPAGLPVLKRLGLAAALGGFVFAAQMFNVPVLPGISAHL